METAAALLRKLTMLRACSDDEIEGLAALVVPMHVEKGDVIITEGDRDLGAYLVIEGWASVLRSGRTIFSLGVGQFIGEMANLHDKPRSATVVATTPMTLVAVPAEHFDAFTNHPAVSQRLTESLSLRVKKALESRNVPERARNFSLRRDLMSGFVVTVRGMTGGTYRTVRDRTEALAAPLGPEDQVVQSMPDASPTKWHRAHTTWFFEEFILGPHAGRAPSHPEYRYLFNSYYEAVGPRQPRAAHGVITRPTIDEIAEYRAEVDDAMATFLDAGVDDEVAALVELGLHHEQQHQELVLTDAKHLLHQNPLRPAYSPAPFEPTPVDVLGWGWVEHPGGIVAVGHDARGFAFDNELPRHDVLLQPFALADRAVTAGEWHSFMADGGYRRPELWLSDGWYAVQQHGWDAPMYWEPAADRGRDEWDVFTLGGLRPVDPSEPATHVSYYEADAYARWAGHRLPTEQEWEAVAHPLASEFADCEGTFVDDHLEAGTAVHPRPAGPHRPGGPPRQLFGDVWEWTASAYLPYPGFAPAPGAVGEYNGKFMSGQHVLRGGCCATPAGHVRTTYRNFFPPSARWVFNGVRLAQS